MALKNESGRDPSRVQQESPERKPWELTKSEGSAFKGGTLCFALTGLFSGMVMISGLTPWAFLFRPSGLVMV